MEAARVRRRLTAEERRAGILRAVLAVFSERGFHATAIDAFAREAGISKALVYKHSGSKQELYGNLLEQNARDPGPRAIDAERAEHERAIRMLAQMPVGGVQSLANWWADHQEVPRAHLVEMVMDFAWLGLERLSGGERWPGPR